MKRRKSQEDVHIASISTQKQRSWIVRLTVLIADNLFWVKVLIYYINKLHTI